MIAPLLSMMIWQQSTLIAADNPLLYKTTPAAPITATAPVPKIPSTTPSVDATAVLVMDPLSGTVLYEYNADAPLPIASLTKVMTAIVALETYGMNDVVTVSDAARTIEGTKVWLYEAERITVADLLRGVLLVSGNDAALALAEHVGYEQFIAYMNKKAEALRLTQSHFRNPTGLDEEGHLSSARDLANMTRYALQRHPFFATTTQVKEMTITSESGITHQLKNTHQMLGGSFPVRGIKTGTTPIALECLITLTEDANGRQLLVVILGSNDRYGATQTLLRWAGVQEK